MSGSGPPKCKTCGTTEWRHICGGLPDEVRNRLVGTIVVSPTAPPSTVAFHDSNTGEFLGAIVNVAAPVGKPKIDRKEYLKLKARERRERQAAEEL